MIRLAVEKDVSFRGAWTTRKISSLMVANYMKHVQWWHETPVPGGFQLARGRHVFIFIETTYADQAIAADVERLAAIEEREPADVLRDIFIAGLPYRLPPVPLVYAAEILDLADGDPDAAAFLTRVDLAKWKRYCSGDATAAERARCVALLVEQQDNWDDGDRVHTVLGDMAKWIERSAEKSE